MPEWTPVHDSAGNVAGWVAPADPGEPDTGYFEADRLPRVRRRADIIGQAADVMANEAFDLDAVWDACQAAGMSAGDVDSAGNAALLLEQIERRYPDL